MRTHQQNLQTLQANLAMFQGYAQADPSEWNLTSVADLTRAVADYRRFMEGRIERHQMCWTAIELTMDMPAWGTYGT